MLMLSSLASVDVKIIQQKNIDVHAQLKEKNKETCTSHVFFHSYLVQVLGGGNKILDQKCLLNGKMYEVSLGLKGFYK